MGWWIVLIFQTNFIVHIVLSIIFIVALEKCAFTKKKCVTELLIVTTPRMKKDAVRLPSLKFLDLFSLQIRLYIPVHIYIERIILLF